MRVLLIAANTERTNILPLPLGLACVAAACRASGHEAVLLDLMFEADPESAIRHAIEAVRPEVIGISVRNIDDQNMASPRFLLPAVRQFVAVCRSVSNAPVVVGGPGYSIFPESALRYLGADIGVRGEGESVFPALLDRLRVGSDAHGLPGVYLPGRPADDWSFANRLGDLPLPEPDAWIPAVPGSRDFWIPVQGKRGCPMRCSFCSTKDIEGTTTRSRPPEAIATWLEKLAWRGFRSFVFVDNTFNIPPTYAKATCRAIIERGLDLNLWCIVYPKWIDRELVDLMARAGCREVSLGFESGSDRMLLTFNKRFNTREVAAGVELFARAGIRRTGFLLLGGPGETRGTVEASLEFAESLNLTALKITVGLRVYPSTALAATAVSEGVLAPDQELLWPTFYLAPNLRDWLPERIAAYRVSHPSVM